MSTAGKVLTVLVLLVTLVWVVMLSAVTQLNVNWEQKIAAQQKNLDDLTKEAAQARDSILALTEEARAEQDATDRDLRVVLEKIAATEGRQSSTTEYLTRLKAQVADYLAAVERARTNLATREAEKAKNLDDLAKKRDEIAKAQATNAELRTQLAQLQDEFKRLLAENTAKLDRAAKEATAKPASNVRESPSS